MVANQVLEKTSQGEEEEDVAGKPNYPDTEKVESSIEADQTPSNTTASEQDLKRIHRKFSPGYNLFIIIGGTAIAEIIAMIAVYFFRDLPYYQQVFIDASIMTVIIFPILYFLSFRPILQHMQRIYRADMELRKREQKEHALLQTIHTMQLDIARDLHDTIGQNIGFLRMKLDYLSGRKSTRRADLQLEIRKMAQAANETYDLVRGTLAILQSTNSSDLYRLFTRYADQIEERASFKIEYSARGEPKPLSAPRIRQIFYIYREMLNNVEKHAGASLVAMEMIWDPDHLTLILTDNGRGFDVEEIPFGGHYGLKFMRERVELLNGTLDLQSTIGSGTRVEVKIPCEPS